MNKFARFLSVIISICFVSIVAAAQQNGGATPATPPATPAAPVLAPSPSLAKDSRCFELRTYYAAPGKLEELHARFRNHTIRLFKKHGMKIVGFWGPTDKADGAEEKLVYILAFPSRAARDKAFDSFRKDPEWEAVKAASEKNGKLTEKIDSVFLMASDYSPIK
jgi:uncharacterized protein (DUF1330 family)